MTYDSVSRRGWRELFLTLPPASLRCELSEAITAANVAGEFTVPARKSASVKHIALLRGINVGKAKRVAMADLRKLCEGLGYEDVSTLLNSGNIVFSAPRADPRAAAKIQKEIASRLGVSCRVIVLTGDQLDQVVAENPIAEGESNPPRFLVMVLANATDRARVAELAMLDFGVERVGLGTHAAYLWCANGILESPALVAIGKLLGDAVTSRNWATIKKLHALTRAGVSARA